MRITDIWVDSPASRDGGRSLWAIPKELADLPLRTARSGRHSRTTFSAVAEGRQVASAAFTSMPRAALVRLPFAMRHLQEPTDGTTGGHAVRAAARGRCRAAGRGSSTDGPLAFLHGRRPLVSLRLRDVRLRFG